MDNKPQQLFSSTMSRFSLGSVVGGGGANRSGRPSIGSVSFAGRKSLATGAGGMGGRKLPSTGLSRFSTSGRSNQSLLGIRSEFCAVESYGFQLPVLINEALTFNEKNVNVSVHCAENGWSWVVHGRRLLVWQYKDIRHTNASSSPLKAMKETPGRSSGQQGRRGATTISQCRELTLPHCDIGNKASLVSVFQTDGHQMASCIAVSPTGEVRYWPSIAHDGTSVDLFNILDGQEFDYLLPLPPFQLLPLSYLLVTTTCNIILLQLQLQNGRHVLQHRTIRQASGFLGGIGKKFASIIIGMNSANDKENKFVAVACEEPASLEQPSDAVVYVLADRWIQCWRLASTGYNSEQLLFEDSDIVRRIRDEFQQKYWNFRDPMEVSVHLLDMKMFLNKIYILVGAANASHAPQMYYSIVVLSNTNEGGMNLETFAPLKLSNFYSINSEVECLSLRMIVSRTHLYVYDGRFIYPISLTNLMIGEMETEKIEFHLQDDRIMCASVIYNGQIPLFFSRSHGLITVAPSDMESMDLLNNTCTTITEVIPEMAPQIHNSSLSATQLMNNNATNTTALNIDDPSGLYIYELDPDLLSQEYKDDISQMKAAFVYFVKHNDVMSNALLKELLQKITQSRTSGALTKVNRLDQIVIKIAEDLAEDIPAADPRWENQWQENDTASRIALGSSSSMRIISQLREKDIAMQLFVKFLQNVNIWEKLTVVESSGSNVMRSTTLSISDIHEKIIAAISLRTIHDNHNRMIDDAIQLWSERSEFKALGNLTNQDLFYVHLCKFQEIFESLCDLADERVSTQHQSSALAAYISEVDEIALSVYTEIMDFRKTKTNIYCNIHPVGQGKSGGGGGGGAMTSSKNHVDFPHEYLPWTAMSGKGGIRDSFSHLIDISVKYGARGTNDTELKVEIYQQLAELIDVVLDGRKQYLDTVRDQEKHNVLMQQFESQRRDLISILIEDGHQEFAIRLAEKYLDFQSLVLICDLNNDQDRLDHYIKRFESQNFSQFAINWHLRQNRQGEVFERFKGNQAALSQFLRDHPTLGWIQLVFNGDFERAAKILFQLAQNETEFVQRKKTMLSLAKLAIYSAPDSELSLQLDAINAELSVIDYQEQLNVKLLQSFGYDVEHQKVLRIDEIINLLITEENEAANEFEFRKALELLNFIEEPFETRHRIWCAAILRDNWTEYDSDSALNYIQNLLFFKLIELCHLMDGDFEGFLPPMNDFLNSSELGDLIHNKAFQFLLKLLYEYLKDAYNNNGPTLDNSPGDHSYA